MSHTKEFHVWKILELEKKRKRREKAGFFCVWGGWKRGGKMDEGIEKGEQRMEKEEEGREQGREEGEKGRDFSGLPKDCDPPYAKLFSKPT